MRPLEYWLVILVDSSFQILPIFQVGSVEIQWKGHLEKVYYPMPKSGGVRNKIKEELKWGLDRKSKFDKQRDFLMWSSEVRGGTVFILNSSLTS